MERLDNLKKNDQEYKVNSGRLLVLIAALLNIVLCLYVNYRFIYDDLFMENQIGFTLETSLLNKYIISIIITAIALYINYKFINKSLMYKHLLGFIQTVFFAFILKNIVVLYVNIGFKLEHYLSLAIGFIIMSLLIYLTLFSYQVLLYFGLEKKMED